MPLKAFYLVFFKIGTTFTFIMAKYLEVPEAVPPYPVKVKSLLPDNGYKTCPWTQPTYSFTLPRCVIIVKPIMPISLLNFMQGTAIVKV